MQARVTRLPTRVSVVRLDKRQLPVKPMPSRHDVHHDHLGAVTAEFVAAVVFRAARVRDQADEHRYAVGS
jgi:hypothetical protein